MAAAKQWWVYVLECGDRSLYTGITNDLEQRLERHQQGKGAAYTRSHLPVRLIYREKARGKGAALSREAAIKKLSRSEKLALVSARGPASRGRGSRARAGRPCRAASRSARGT